MTILSSDVKFVASQVMDDVEEGGGAPTANVINDATSNNIFPDISELDRAGGRVNMRKVHVAIKTNNADGYFGGNVIVAEPPNDPLVAVTLFTNGDVFDRRSDASSRVESYLVKGPLWDGYLYGNHVTGQRTIQIFCRPTAALPSPGRTLALVQFEGLESEKLQYVRLTRVESEIRKFYFNGDDDYDAKVVTCDLSDALRYDFAGSAASRSFLPENNKAIIRDTTVADAGTYCGVVPLQVAAEVGDFNLKATSVYTQLVPNSRTETSLLDLNPADSVTALLATTPRRIEVGVVQHCQRRRVSQENRGFNWVTILTPLPSPGTVNVTFRALGQNYSLSDDGEGSLTGQGAGTVNYLTGTVSVTLAALPDDRSNVCFYWGETQQFTDRSGLAGFRAPEYSFELKNNCITPSSLEITWLSEGVLRTATDNGSGKITGDASGEIMYGPGYVYLRPNYMIDAGGEFSIDYTWSSMVTETKSGLTPDGSGVVNFTVEDEPAPKSILCRWITTKNISKTSGSTASASFSESSASSSTTVTAEQLTKQEWRPPVFTEAYGTDVRFFAYDEYGRKVPV